MEGRIMAYKCIHCGDTYHSSQRITDHPNCQFKDGKVKGTGQRNVFLIDLNHQVQQQGSGANSSFLQQQQVALDIGSAGVHQAGAQNLENLTAQPSLSPTSSSRRPLACHQLGVRDHKIIARLIGRLTKEEQDIIMRLVECARELARQSSTKSIGLVEVIPDKDSEAAPMIGTTKQDIVTIEDSDDESNHKRI